MSTYMSYNNFVPSENKRQQGKTVDGTVHNAISRVKICWLLMCPVFSDESEKQGALSMRVGPANTCILHYEQPLGQSSVHNQHLIAHAYRIHIYPGRCRSDFLYLIIYTIIMYIYMDLLCMIVRVFPDMKI